MSVTTSFEEKLATEYGTLSTRLKAAADYVAAHQVDVATRSLRSISGASGIAPATFSRLARALGFETYEELREMLRDVVNRRVVSFRARASRLQEEAGDAAQPPFLQRQSAACRANISSLGTEVNLERLEQTVDRLHRARRVLLLGALGSTGVVEYLAYMANYFTDSWEIAGRMGASLGGGLVALGPDDALIVVTKPPFTRRVIEGAEFAASRGAYVVVLTDTHTCPALAHASTSFIVPTDSPQFFSSYAATLVLAETIIGMLVSRAGPAAQDRIAEIEATNRQLGEVWDG